MSTRSATLVLVLALAVHNLAGAATFNVAAGDVSSLVANINAANNEGLNPGADTIVLADGNYDLTTINNYWYGPTGLPPIRSDITIRNNGNGASIRRTGGPNFRLFYVSGGNTSVGPAGAGTLTLINLTLSGGFARGGDGGALSGGGGGLGAGGAIYNQGALNLYRVTLSGNTARGGDGGSDDGLSVESAGGGGMGGNGASATPGGGGVFSRSGGGGGMGGNGGVLTGTSTGGSGGGGISQTTLPGDTANNGGSPTSTTTGGAGGGSGGAGGNNGTGGANGSLGGGGGGNGASSTVAGGAGGIGGGGGGGNTDSQGGFGGGAGNCVANSRGGFGGASGSGGSNPSGDLGFGGGGGGAVASGSQPGGFGGGDSTANSFSGGGGAGLGGAIFNDAGTLSAFNVTITGNTAQGGNGGAAFSAGGAGGGAGFGGGIFNRSGTLTLTHATIASNFVIGGTGTVGSTTNDNGSADGGAVYHLGINLGAVSRTSTSASSSASLTIANSVLANSNTGSDLVIHNLTTAVGAATVNVTRSSANIVETVSQIGAASITGTAFTTGDPQLSTTLAANGAASGAPLTLFPSSGSSPILNTGSNAQAVLPAFATGLSLSDQRGANFARISGPPATANVDLGAVEVQYAPLVLISAPTLTAVCTGTNPSVSYTVTYVGATTLNHATTTVATGSATATVGSSGSGTSRTVSFSGISVPLVGTLAFQVPAGAGVNNANNAADAAVTGTSINSSIATTSNSFQVGTAPTIVTTSLPDGNVGSFYNQTILTAPTGAAFTLTGILPNNLTLSSGGVISGTPTATGSFPFSVTASAPGTSCSDTQGLSINIISPAASISVAPASVLEDGTGNLVYTVTLNPTAPTPTVVNISTAGTATAGTDYTGAVATLTIPANTASATITIDPVTDSTPEANETVVLSVAAGTGYTVGAPSSVTGTIQNDDVLPPLVSTFFVNPLQSNTNNTTLNGTARLAIAITNPPANIGNLTGLAISDTFPPGIEVDASPGASNTCGGTFAPTPGATSISLTGGGPLTPANQCTIFVVVRATAAGVVVNTTGNVSATESGAGLTASGTLNVYQPPVVTLSFTPANILQNQLSVLQLSVTSPTAGLNLSGVNLTDNFPPGMVAGSPPVISTTNCGGLTLSDSGGGSFQAGDTGVRLNNFLAPAPVACVVQLNVVGQTVGALVNTTDAPTSTNGGTGLAATATLNVGAAADLAITKTDGVTSATPGGSVTYTITASNSGPSADSSATVADTFPAALACTWTCVGAGGGSCTASGSGNINDTVNLPVGGSTTYTASCTINSSATGTLSNTATVTASPAVTDSNAANNSANDSDTLVAQADLSISKTDGLTSIAAGSNTTYTITASNAGPSNAPAATVADTFPAFCTSANWTCTGAGGGSCPASGTGNINAAVSLPAGGSASFSAVCAIAAGASGTLANTATVTATGGVIDSNATNNNASDSTTLCPATVVSNGNDSGAGSLRQTIADACAGSTITFQAGVATVTLSSGEVVINKNLTIQGPGAANLRIDAGNTSRLIRIDAGAQVGISGLTLAGGNGVSPVQSGSGSAVLVLGELQLQDAAVRENAANAVYVGPACSINGTAEYLEVSRSLFTANAGTSIFVNCGLAIIRNSTVAANGGSGFAAVSQNFGRTLLFQSTVVGNANRGLGTAIYAQASIIAGNAAGDLSGNAFISGGSNLIENLAGSPFFGVTSGNLTGVPAGLAALGAYGGPTATMAPLPGSAAINAVVNSPEVQVLVRREDDTAPFTLTFNGQTTAALTSPTEATLQAALESLPSIGSGNVDVVFVNSPFALAVAVVQFTGALAGSNQPAITTSRPGILVRQARDGGVPLATDQRGIARPQQGAADIGAFESRGFTLALTGGDNQSAGPGLAFATPLAATVTALGPGEPVQGGLVSFTPPGAGASASLAPNPAPIGAAGVASSTATANTTVGAYNIAAAANGATPSLSYALTNAGADLSISDFSLTESNAGSSNATFAVTRTNSLTAFSVPYSVTAGTAQAGSDYTTTVGTLNFAVGGALTQTIDVPVVGDLIVEATETATVNLGAVSNTTGLTTLIDGSGLLTISDNDSATVQFAPTSVSQSEATSPMAFTVTLSAPVQSGVTLAVNSTPGTATAADFTAISGGTVTFAPNTTTSQTVNVAINNDALDEDDETFSLTLSGLTATGNVTLGAATANATILDDDPTPTVSVTSPSLGEGNAGTSVMNFVVTLGAVSGRAVTFNAATADGTATTANNDYVALASTPFTIAAGSTSVTIPVTINGDTPYEGNETFSLNLTGVSNATPASLSGTGTIVDDDQQPTTTTITGDTPDPTVTGQPYLVSVTVAAQTTSPLGTVTISDGSASCGPVTLTAGTAPNSSASCNLTSPSAGAKTLTASYSAASTAFGNSSGTTAHQVNAASTAISVVGPVRSRINQPTTFTFALSVSAPGAGSPAGTVTLSSGASTCNVTVPTATPSCALSFNALGSRTVSAAFAPSNGSYTASSSSGPGNAQTLVYAQSDIAVTKSDAVSVYRNGDLIVYTVTVRNNGPDTAANIRVRDDVPVGLTGVSWSCDASGGAVCAPTGGSGSLDVTVPSLINGALLSYTFFGTVAGAPDSIVNTALVELPADTTIEDPTLSNNSASDTDLRDALFQNGFEDAAISAPTGGYRLPSAALRSALDEVAVAVYRLSDANGEALRVYARVWDGQVQYALATRDASGALRLGAWRSYASEPNLSWTARQQANGWVLERAELL